MPETQNAAIALANRSIGIRSNIQNPLAVQMLREFGLDKPMVMPLDASRPVTVKLNAAGQLEWLKVQFEGPVMPDVARAIDEWNTAPADKNGLTKLQNAVLDLVQNRLSRGLNTVPHMKMAIAKKLNSMVTSQEIGLLPMETLARLRKITTQSAQALLVEAMAAVDACASLTREETPRKVLDMLEATMRMQYCRTMPAPLQPVPEMPAWRNLLRQPDLHLQGLGRELRPDEVTVCRASRIYAAAYELRYSRSQALPVGQDVFTPGLCGYYLTTNQARQLKILDKVNAGASPASNQELLEQELGELIHEEQFRLIEIGRLHTPLRARDLYQAACGQSQANAAPSSDAPRASQSQRPTQPQAKVAAQRVATSPSLSPASRFASQKTQCKSRG